MMILIWLIYIFISLLISILIRNLFQGFIKKRVFFSFIFSLLSTSWFIYHGTQKFWYKDGVKKKELNYVDGKKNGYEKKWDALGILISEILWKNDEKVT